MPHNVTFIPGDGTGPEIAEATKRVLEGTGVEFDWDQQEAGIDVYESGGKPLPDETLQSIRDNGVAIKGPTTTPVGIRLPVGERRPSQGARPLLVPAPL